MPAALLAAALCCGAGAAAAASLQISPVSIRFAAEQRAAGITLQNLGETTIYGQVRVYRWDQQDGEDVLTPTRDLLASPPIVKIAPQSDQSVRLVQATPGVGGAEQSYRVLIDEIAGSDNPAGKGVDIRLRYSVPVFMAAAGALTPEALVWQVLRKAGNWTLRIRNRGQRHAQIGSLSLTNQAGAQFQVGKGLFGYVLAGREREWRLPVDPQADLSGPLSASVVVNARPVARYAVDPE